MSVVSYLKLTPKEGFVQQFRRDLEEFAQLVRAQKGFIQVEILRPLEDANGYVILSEWESEDDFKAWEHSPRHQAVMDDFNHRTGEGYSRMRFNRYR